MTTLPRSLLNNVRSALTGNAAYALCQFGMLSALALLTSTTEVGRYALALAITAPVFLFASLKLRQVQVTDAQNEFTFGEYLTERLLTSIIAVVGVVGVAAFLGMEERTYLTVVAVTAFKALESVIDILYGAMQRREQLHLVARSQVCRGLGGFAIFAGCVAWSGRVEVASSALALFTLTQVASNLIRVRRLGVRVLPEFSWRTVRRLTWLALPLGVALSVSSLSINVPRYLVEAFEGTSELGIFAALAYFLTVTGMVMNSLGEAASPRLANLFFAGDYRRFRSMLKKLVLMGALIGVAGVVGVAVFGRQVLGLAFGPEYAAHNDVLLVMMSGSAVLYTSMFIGTAVNAMRRFSIQMPINIVIMATTAGVSWLAVPAWGIMGGAVAMAAGELVALIFYCGLIFEVILPATSGRGRRVAQAPTNVGHVPRHMRRTRQRGLTRRPAR